MPDPQIPHGGVYGDGDVGGERPRRGRPYQQRRPFFPLQRKADENGEVVRDVPAFCDFHLQKAGTAPSAPRHNIAAPVQETLPMALFKKGPIV